MKRVPRVVLAAFVACLLLTLGCTPQTSSTAAADFELPDINPASATYGKTVRASTLWTGNGIVLNFMASWCMPCRMELPALQAIHASGDARVVCVAADEGAGTEDLLALVRSSGLTLPVLYAEPDRAAELAKAYTYDVLPSTYLIGSDGTIRELIAGARPEEAFRQAISASLRSAARRP
jgi:thiol-disulfide isomerase/thioredoxin